VTANGAAIPRFASSINSTFRSYDNTLAGAGGYRCSE
jgi:hypothetical protein